MAGSRERFVQERKGVRRLIFNLSVNIVGVVVPGTIIRGIALILVENITGNGVPIAELFAVFAIGITVFKSNVATRYIGFCVRVAQVQIIIQVPAGFDDPLRIGHAFVIRLHIVAPQCGNR